MSKATKKNTVKRWELQGPKWVQKCRPKRSKCVPLSIYNLQNVSQNQSDDNSNKWVLNEKSCFESRYPLPILQIETVFLFIWNFLGKSSKRYLKSFIKMCISKVFQWDIKWCSFCKLNYLLFQCKKCIKEWIQMNWIDCLTTRFYRTVGGSTYKEIKF